ncbi:S1C family serine protease [Fervidicella metallireducens]|uniref:S1C family serine protease n=1 Tax=Fervidicella metallireducens TaxID=655338 RepID=UPI000AF22849
MDDFNYNHEMDNIDEILKECVEKEVVIQSDEREYKEDTKKGKKPRSLLTAVIAAATAGTLAGGIIVGALGLYILPKTEMFKNTELYKSIKAEYNTKSSGTQVVSTSVSLGNDLTIPEIAKKVGPAVVGVSTKSVAELGGYFMEPFEEESEGMGSGIIFSKDGYIVTNYHVISGAEKIKVILNSGKEYNAKVVNYNANMDMAVIKITDKVDNLPTAEFGDSDKLEVGELAVAIGNPLGRDFLGSVTAGVVSAVTDRLKLKELH